MDARLAKRLGVGAAHGEEYSPGKAPIDFIALARPQAAPARALELADDLEAIHSCLDTPFYRAMIEDLRDLVVAPIGWLSRNRT